MSKRSAEDIVADQGDICSPASATKHTITNNHDRFNLIKKQFVLRDGEQYERRKHLQQHHHHQKQQQQQKQSCGPSLPNGLPEINKQYSDQSAVLLKKGSKDNKMDKGSPQSSKHDTNLQQEHSLEDTEKSIELTDGPEDSSKHLVKTLSDMPIFVAIEDFRVASYTIDGEPHLCLPNLLHFIQQRYPIDKVVEIFEETGTNFISATPKQTEGFIKATVLPPTAKSCPLIKRSDADRICLALFDQFHEDIKDTSNPTNKSKEAKIGGADKSVKLERGPESANTQIKQKTISPLTDSIESSNNTLNSNAAESESGSNDDLNKKIHNREGQINDPSIHIKSENHGRLLVDESPKLSKSPAYQTDLLHNRHQLTENSQSLDNTDLSSTPKEASNDSYEPQKDASSRDTLFEEEAQRTILDMARAATSTLVINVYHRCFGKCRGNYYPSLLKNSDSECIECSSCHRMFSPRRFTGHTHGTKETNVCHWGFNSYNWRHYIKLSRTQAQNSLDDDELIAQLGTLKSTLDNANNTKVQDSYLISEDERRSQSKCERTRSIETKLVDRSAQGSCSSINKVTTRSTKQSPATTSPYQGGINSPHQIPMSSPHQPFPLLDCSNYSQTHQPSTSSDRHAITIAPASKPSHWANPNWLINDQLLSNPYISSSALRGRHFSAPLPYPTNCHSFMPPHCSYQFMASSSAAALAAATASSHSNLNDFSAARTSIMDRISSIAREGNKSRRGEEETRGVTRRDSSPSFTPVTRSPVPAHQSPNNQPSPSATTERLVKQDIFVSGGLANYLSARGLHPELAKDIVDNTLDLIDKSRMLF